MTRKRLNINEYNFCRQWNIKQKYIHVTRLLEGNKGEEGKKQ